MLVAKLVRSFLNLCLYRINDFVLKTSLPQQPESSSIPEQGYLCIVFLDVSLESGFQEVFIAHHNIFSDQRQTGKQAGKRAEKRTNISTD